MTLSRRMLARPAFESPRRSRAGVEHELRLWIGDQQADFRRFIGDVARGVPTLDPGDPRARRLPSGVALTADGREAELATPPVPVSGGMGHAIDELLRRERTELRDLAAPLGVDRVTGFSTHLNISVSDDLVVRLGQRFAESCALAMATVTEGHDSQGVFVRARRGRLEFGGDYVEGPRLVAALALMTCCVAGLRKGFQPALRRRPTLEPSREKFGWFISPDQHDPDALDPVWTWARPRAQELGIDPAVVDEALALPHTGERCTFEKTVPEAQADHGVAPRERPGEIHGETEWLTWRHVVWAFRDRTGSVCRAVVAAESEPQFLRDLDAGLLDDELRLMLRKPRRRQRLLVNAQLPPDELSLWHDVRPGALVPAERLPDGTVPRVSRRAARRDLRRSAA